MVNRPYLGILITHRFPIQGTQQHIQFLIGHLPPEKKADEPIEPIAFLKSFHRLIHPFQILYHRIAIRMPKDTPATAIAAKRNLPSHSSVLLFSPLKSLISDISTRHMDMMNINPNKNLRNHIVIQSQIEYPQDYHRQRA